jgi:hypothetical protein
MSQAVRRGVSGYQQGWQILPQDSPQGGDGLWAIYGLMLDAAYKIAR